jgi:Phasin protein
MSTTTRNADPTQKAYEHVAKSSKTATAANGPDHSKETAHTVAETAADTMTAMSSKAIEQSREAIMAGVHTAAGVGSNLADISFGRGHDVLSAATHMMDIYRDASERTTGGVQALFSSWMAIGRGLQQMQQAWLGILDHTVENTGHKPQDILRCKNMIEVAEVQRDLCVGAVNHALESSSRLIELMNQTAQNAARPLQESSGGKQPTPTG